MTLKPGKVKAEHRKLQYMDKKTSAKGKNPHDLLHYSNSMKIHKPSFFKQYTIYIIYHICVNIRTSCTLCGKSMPSTENRRLSSSCLIMLWNDLHDNVMTSSGIDLQVDKTRTALKIFETGSWDGHSVSKFQAALTWIINDLLSGTNQNCKLEANSFLLVHVCLKPLSANESKFD